jgi:predicted metalloprotease with PDZ domain
MMKTKSKQSNQDNRIAYTIVPKDLGGHLFTVTVSVTAPDKDGQVFALPAWIPGSYMIREFAKNIVEIHAASAGQTVALTKLDKDTWKAAPCRGKLTLTYDVYAWDLSVRTAHLDQTHGFFNGTSVFLRVVGREDGAHVVDIQRAPDAACAEWRVATAMKPLKAKRHDFGTYIAENYDELVDHPVEMGTFALGRFTAHGVSHDVAVTGIVPRLDMARLCADLKKICEAQIALFEPKTLQAPVKRYVFLIMAVGDGYGGLEHRASTAVLCGRNDLPVKGKPDMSDAYSGFLGLCSHEYFHTWHVKRIKPAVFVPYDYQKENYTSLLWLFEGFTTYYDDLMLVRSGVMDVQGYFRRLQRIMTNVLRSSGRLKQSMADASFDAWIKYYRQDENAPNALVNYYTKGALLAMALDLTLREQTDGKQSLDDVMRVLWQRYGKDFYEKPETQRGIAEDEFEALIDEVTGMKWKRFFDRHVRGADDVPLARLLSSFGIALTDHRKKGKPSLDVRVQSAAHRGSDCLLANVYEGGAAHKAGMSANDIIVALDGLRVTGHNLDTLLSRYKVGDTVTLHVFRRDELRVFKVKLQGDNAPQPKLTVEKKTQKEARALERWLQL